MNENNEKTVWVIGHRNPDTDSVCGAIAYSYLKNKTEKNGFKYIPKKAGPINEETRYVLQRFGAAEPETVGDVRTQIRDLDFRKTESISDHCSLKNAWELMKAANVITLPITKEDGTLEGLIVNGDIAYSYMDVYDNKALGRARTQYKNIVDTLKGSLHCGNVHGYFVKGKVVVASGDHETMKREIEEDDLVILGNVRERQLTALEEKPSCLIVTGVKSVPDDIIAKADAIDCVLITTEYDSFTTARLINQSMPVKYFMTKDHLVTFEPEDKMDEVRERMGKIRHRDFPVVDEDGLYIGMFSRRNLLNMQRKKVILVDHNEKGQAVEGIEEAEILEIVDHHRIGSIETLQPIFFRNQPLGCSSTIIFHMYVENEVSISEKNAGLMLSAIISDTLMFRSPTCTPYDVSAAKELAAIAGVDIEKLASEMFEAGSDFRGKSEEAIFNQDFKVFHVNDISFGVAQVSAVSVSQLESVKKRLVPYIEKVISDDGLDMVFMLLTDIMDSSSEVIFAGAKARDSIASAFGRETLKPNEDSAVLAGVVSRKKQFIPVFMEALQENEGQ